MLYNTTSRAHNMYFHMTYVQYCITDSTLKYFNCYNPRVQTIIIM